MPSAKTFDATIIEDASVYITALILNTPSNIPFTQSTISLITWKLFRTDNRTQISSGTLTVASVIFNTLQTWPDKPNESGYNFATSFSGSLFASGASRYRLEITFTPTGGEAFPVIFNLNPLDLMGS
jgi:hypothetical protein